MDFHGPRERLFEKGVKTLSDVELLAVLLRTGTSSQKGFRPFKVLELAESLIDKEGNLSNLLSASAEQLLSLAGLGQSKVAILLAVREVAYRLSNPPSSKPLSLSEPQSVYQLFSDIAFESQEVLEAAFLTHQNRLLKRKLVFKGSLGSSQANPREIMREALRANAAKLIVAHNHPSQDPAPSQEDEHFTNLLFQAGKVVGISLVDHLIICDKNQYFSFSEAGKIPPPNPGVS